MSEFPNNPEDVAAQLSTTGDKWRESWTPADRLTEALVTPHNGELFYLDLEGLPSRPLDSNDFEAFGITRVGTHKWNSPSGRVDPTWPEGAPDATFTAAYHDDGTTMSVYGNVEKRWYWYDV
jgi:hypothetical protein